MKAESYSGEKFTLLIDITVSSDQDVLSVIIGSIVIGNKYSHYVLNEYPM